MLSLFRQKDNGLTASALRYHLGFFNSIPSVPSFVLLESSSRSHPLYSHTLAPSPIPRAFDHITVELDLSCLPISLL
ncbi:hypothetical protein A0J61_04525 [Choanephora cucurbitarum]|uniref:Uncharacterized protein n=1 Tax=Choanephora cucurbitarum TaxID=101091 RepID=A0A1C7NFT2_9FUNG|nr:hypothetical protein A0J61_04525 [Choanephora cucurbitarum]